MKYTYLVTPCPHCFEDITIFENDIILDNIDRPQIFSHFIIREEGIQVSPSVTKEEILELIQEDKIYGCGKKYKLEIDSVNGKYIIIPL